VEILGCNFGMEDLISFVFFIFPNNRYNIENIKLFRQVHPKILPRKRISLVFSLIIGGYKEEHLA